MKGPSDRRRWSQADQDRAQALKDRGLSSREIAARMGWGETTVRARLAQWPPADLPPGP